MNRWIRRSVAAPLALCLFPLAGGCAGSETDPQTDGERTAEAGQELVAGASTRLRSAATGYSLCIAVKDANPYDGATVGLESCAAVAHEKLFLVDMNDGTYSLKAAHSGKCLDVYGVSTSPGAAVVQWACHGGSNQRFRLAYKRNNEYSLVAQHSGLCVEGTGELRQYPCDGKASQRFHLDIAPRSQADRDKCTAAEGTLGQTCVPTVQPSGLWPTYTNCVYGFHVGAGYGTEGDASKNAYKIYDRIDQCAFWHDKDCWERNTRTGVVEGGYGCTSTVNFMTCVYNVVPESLEEAQAKECIMHTGLEVSASICDPAGWGTLYPIYPGWTASRTECSQSAYFAP